jgi:3-methyl-2-oxobutanoate hydroxymethyltransferase
MTVLGYDTTLPVTIDDMVRHAAAVVRGAQTALVVADLPFLTYADEASAIRAAGRLMQEAGVHAVKLEGGRPAAPVVRRLVELGVPVMGHLGYTPQSTLQIGVRMQAKDAPGAEALLADAAALEAAGAFAVVLELIPDALAKRVTQSLAVPTIGIGAGPACDGQVQVWHDILGLYGDRTPKHAKRYAELGALAAEAIAAYAREVAAGEFPPPRG